MGSCALTGGLAHGRYPRLRLTGLSTPLRTHLQNTSSNVGTSSKTGKGGTATLGFAYVRPGIAVRERRRCPLPGKGFYEVK